MLVVILIGPYYTLLPLTIAVLQLEHSVFGAIGANYAERTTQWQHNHHHTIQIKSKNSHRADNHLPHHRELASLNPNDAIHGPQGVKLKTGQALCLSSVNHSDTSQSWAFLSSCSSLLCEAAWDVVDWLHVSQPWSVFMHVSRSAVGSCHVTGERAGWWVGKWGWPVDSVCLCKLVCPGSMTGGTMW